MPLLTPPRLEHLLTLLSDWVQYGADLHEVPLPEDFIQDGDPEAELRAALGIIFAQWARGEPLPLHYGGENLPEINYILTGRSNPG